ncbi:MAG: M20 family metallopeptidase [Blastocatellia bacterium]
MPGLNQYFSTRQETIVALIRHLVERETTSREAARLDEIARFTAELLQPLASTIELIASPAYGSHLRARFNFNPESSAESASRQLLVIGHLDTVWPVGTLARLPFRVTDEGTAHGPGIFDMKSGVAVVIEALRSIAELKLTTRRPVTMLLTCDEEIGSQTSRHLIEEEARKSAAALVLEPPIPGGIVKTARKGVGGFTIRATGRAAHAGLDPRHGINAIVELAHQTLRLNELNNYDSGTTINVGVVSGGTTSNVIPAQAMAKVDMRFWTLAEGQRIDDYVKSLQPVIDGAQLTITGGINRPPMIRSEGNAALYEHARQLAAEIGFELHEGSVGGGSDGNFTAALGVPTLDGLGVDGAGAHAEHEHIILADIPRRAALITRLLQTV